MDAGRLGTARAHLRAKEGCAAAFGMLVTELSSHRVMSYCVTKLQVTELPSYKLRVNLLFKLI